LAGHIENQIFIATCLDFRIRIDQLEVITISFGHDLSPIPAGNTEIPGNRKDLDGYILTNGYSLLLHASLLSMEEAHGLLG
jgi:hypothetical protein